MRQSQANRFEQQFTQHVTHQLSKWVGAIPMVMPILRTLRVAEIVDEHCPGREAVNHGTSVAVLALNRLLSPKPLYKIEEWMRGTMLEEALEVTADQMYDIHPRLTSIWQEVVVQAVVAYDIDLSQLHYDITSLYFEGEYDQHPEGTRMVDYGYSRDHRPDAKQVNLGVNVTGQEGIPLVYRVLSGRTADRTTPLENMAALRQLLERPELAEKANDFLLVNDRAMLDRSVLVTYAEQNVHWLGPLAADGHLGEVLSSVTEAELDQQPLDYRPTSQPDRDPLRYHGVLRQVRLEHDDQAPRGFPPIQVLVVRSRTKAKLDREKRQTYLKRLTDRLEQIASMLNTRRYKRRAYAQQQINKALGGNPAKRLMDVELSGEDGNLSLTFAVNEERLAQTAALDGRYLLGTNHFALDAHQMLRRFKRQEVVERRFKTIKGPIQVRPFFLHKQERIDGLVFVSMVALLVYTILEKLCRRNGRYITARQVLEHFELLSATCLHFADGSSLMLASALNETQQQLIDLLRFPPPESYFQTSEATT